MTSLDDTSYRLEIYESQIQKRHELSTQLSLTVAETILSWFQANRPGDASATQSGEVNCNEFIIRELEGYQSRHQWDLISYLPIESIDDYRDDSVPHTPLRVASPAMLKQVLLQFTFDDSQLTINGHRNRTKCTYGGSGRVYEIRTGHVDLHPRRQLKSRLPSTWLNGIIYVTDDVRSLPQRLRKSYKAIYGQRVNESTMITDMITGIIGLSMGRVQDSGAAIADRVAAP